MHVARKTKTFRLYSLFFFFLLISLDPSQLNLSKRPPNVQPQLQTLTEYGQCCPQRWDLQHLPTESSPLKDLHLGAQVGWHHSVAQWWKWLLIYSPCCSEKLCSSLLYKTTLLNSQSPATYPHYLIFFSTFTSTNEFAFEEGHQVLDGSGDGGWIWTGHFGRVISDTLYNFVVSWKERRPPFSGVKHLYKNPYWIITSRKAKRWHSSKDCAPEIQGCKKVLVHLSPAFAKQPTPTLQMDVIKRDTWTPYLNLSIVVVSCDSHWNFSYEHQMLVSSKIFSVQA